MTTRGGAIVLFGLVFAGALVYLTPLALAARLLAERSGHALHVIAARGPWHDGEMEIGCRTPGGRLLACGRYRVAVGRDGGAVRLALRQPGEASLALRFHAGGWQASVRGFRLPAAALAAWSPLVEQMRLSGILIVTGSFEAPGQIDLAVAWQGVIGDFALGEQRLHIAGNGDRLTISFEPPVGRREPRPATGALLAGGVSCEATRAPGSPSAAGRLRCRGEIDVVSSGADERFEQLLAASAQRVAPNRYRLQVDA
jgi:hypothetical protein